MLLRVDGADVFTVEVVDTVLTVVEVELATEVVVLGELGEDELVVGTLVVEGTVVLVDVVELGDELRVLEVEVLLVVTDVTLEVDGDLTVDVVGEGLDVGTDVVALGLLVGTLVVVGTVLVELLVFDVVGVVVTDDRLLVEGVLVDGSEDVGGLGRVAVVVVEEIVNVDLLLVEDDTEKIDVTGVFDSILTKIISFDFKKYYHDM